MMSGAKEFNIPVFRENRELVASEDGGLHNPSVLVFNSLWGGNEAQIHIEKFKYPSLSGVQRPAKEDDIAYMTVNFCLQGICFICLLDLFQIPETNLYVSLSFDLFASLKETIGFSRILKVVSFVMTLDYMTNMTIW